MERLTKKFTDGGAYCQEIIDVGIKGINYPTYVGKAIDKLAEYEDLEEQGKLLKLPCAVGDTVYRIQRETFIEYCDILGFAESRTSILGFVESRTVCYMVYIYPDKEDIIELSDFGKTVFLTQEEAEAVLKEL